MNTSPTQSANAASPLSVITGLRACAMETTARQERRALMRLADRLEQGESVEDVLDNDRFVPQYMREMVRMGMQTGKMGSVLEEYLSSAKESRAIWSEFFISLLYPVIVLMVSLLVLGGFLLMTVPSFGEIFLDFGIELPWLTRLVLNLAEFITNFWWLSLLIVLSIPGLWLVHRYTPGRSIRDRLINKIPIIGSARSMAASSEFCSKLALLIDCRLPLHQALFCLSKSIRDANLASISEHLSFKIERGTEPQDATWKLKHMPTALGSTFRWARDPDLFAEGLRASSQMFAAQARVRINQFSFFIEPFTIVLIATGAFLIILSCIMPLIKLLNQLS